jgi:hypothetical protein
MLECVHTLAAAYLAKGWARLPMSRLCRVHVQGDAYHPVCLVADVRDQRFRPLQLDFECGNQRIFRVKSFWED